MRCSLTKGELIRLDGGKSGIRLSCSEGTLWITTGDGLDRLIVAGDSLAIASGCLAVAEALEISDFRLGDPMPAGTPLQKPLTGFLAC